VADQKVLKDSGTRRKFSTGAQRDCAVGKGRLDLAPEEAIMLYSVVLELGCEKYGERNWEKGIPISRLLDSGIRHLLKYKAGMRDEPHLSQACWNLINALQTAIWIQRGLLPSTLFDLPNHVSKKKIGPLSDVEVAHLWRE
jgi:hypothetical protein